jgi:roadblock/LC7 domain-containing protein
MFMFFMLSCCCTVSSFAGHQLPSIKPELLQSMIRVSGTPCELIPSDTGTGYFCSLYIPDFKGSAVSIGFPVSGLRAGKPFLLEIDGMMATVICSRDGKLSVAEGDERIVAAGIFNTLECLFDAVLTMLADVFDSILSLDILGFLESIVSGILGVIICIIY